MGRTGRSRGRCRALGGGGNAAHQGIERAGVKLAAASAQQMKNIVGGRTHGRARPYAWPSGEANWVIFVLSRLRNAWLIVLCNERISGLPLPVIIVVTQGAIFGLCIA